MKLPLFAGLDSLAELGTRSGIDVRPTLLRVLTDLYVQKPSHTPDEDRQYTELALRLMEAVDVATRATVAARLSTYPTAPAHVVARLKLSLPEEWRQPEPPPAPTTEAPMAPPADPRPDAPPTTAIATGEPAESDEEQANDVAPSAAPPAAPPDLTLAAAEELDALFLGANAEERRLILLNLDVVGPPPERLPVARDPQICERLEAAALEHNGREFIHQLARALAIAPAQALRIARDESGEPLVVAAKLLDMPAVMLQRILLFLNPSVGHSVERVRALCVLYGEIAPQAAEHMLALWQSLRPAPSKPARHRPLLWSNPAASPPRASPARSAPASAATTERRSAK